MHNPEFIQENEMHKIFWDFKIQRDLLSQDLVIVKKKKKWWIVPADHRVKLKESKNRVKY